MKELTNAKQRMQSELEKEQENLCFYPLIFKKQLKQILHEKSRGI